MGFITKTCLTAPAGLAMYVDPLEYRGQCETGNRLRLLKPATVIR